MRCHVAQRDTVSLEFPPRFLVSQRKLARSLLESPLQGSLNHGSANFIIGTLSISAFAFAFSAAVFTAVKLVMGVRVSEETEIKGLDVEEHGAPADAQG